MSLTKNILKAQEAQVGMFGIEHPITEWPLSADEFEEFKEEMMTSCKTDQVREMLRLSQRLFVKTDYGQVAVFEVKQ